MSGFTCRTFPLWSEIVPKREEVSSISNTIGRLAGISLPSRILLGILVFGLLAASLLVVALLSGPFSIPAERVFGEMLSLIGLSDSEATLTERTIIFSVRLPRILLALIAGAALAVSGALMQSVFRNPMAEPGVIGLSAGASLGAVTAIRLGLAIISPLFLPGMAFLGSLGTVMVVQAISRFGGRYSIGAMLLAGVAASSFIGAIVSAIILFTRTFDAQREMIFWLVGGLHSTRWEDVLLAGVPFVFCVVIAIFFARDLNLFMTGDEEAQSLGVRTGMARNILIGVVAFSTGAVVAVSGVIGFVGLIAPHAVRLVVGPDNRAVLPLSALCGAALLLGADTLARTVLSPGEVPVGIITALFGAPFFVYLLIRYKRNLPDL